MSEKLEIKITTPADTSGAKATAKELQGVAAATTQATAAGKENASTTKEVAHELGGMAKAAKGGAAAGGLFSEAIHGDIGALLHLGTLLKATKTAITASFAGLATFGLGAAIALFPTLIGWIRGTIDAADEAKKKAKEATDAFGQEKSAAEKLNEVTVEKFKTELDGISERADAAKKFLDALYEVQGKIAAASEGLELARISADETITPEEKARRTAAVKERYKGLANEREDKKAEDDLGRMQTAAKEARELADRKAAEAEQIHLLRAANVEAPEARARIKKNLEKQLAEIDAADIARRDERAAGGGLKPEALAEAKSDQALRAYINEQLEYIKAREKTLDFSPDVIRNRSALDERVKNADAAAKESAAKATAAQKEATEAESRKSLLDSNNPRIRAMERATARVPGLQTAADALDRGEIPEQYRRQIIDRAIGKTTDRLAQSHNIISDRVQAATEQAANAGAETASQLGTAIAGAIRKEFGAASPALAKTIADAISAAVGDIAGDIRSELRTVKQQLQNSERR